MVLHFCVPDQYDSGSNHSNFCVGCFELILCKKFATAPKIRGELFCGFLGVLGIIVYAFGAWAWYTEGGGGRPTERMWIGIFVKWDEKHTVHGAGGGGTLH